MNRCKRFGGFVEHLRLWRLLLSTDILHAHKRGRVGVEIVGVAPRHMRLPLLTQPRQHAPLAQRRIFCHQRNVCSFAVRLHVDDVVVVQRGTRVALRAPGTLTNVGYVYVGSNMSRKRLLDQRLNISHRAVSCVTRSGR